jgi:EmrB/QacA subfamily drug resistance transporter
MTSVIQFGCDRGVAHAATVSLAPVRCGAVLAASSLGSCLVFVTGAIVNVALAAIGRDLGLNGQSLQWLLNAELLPLAALTLVGGALGDRYGQKQIFLSGITLFFVATLGCVVARNVGELIALRFLQGIGEALILPTGLSVLGQAFPAERKGWAVGVWSASAAVASAVAPALAGAILDHGSWRGCFAMEIPLAALAFVFAAIWLPRPPLTQRLPIDLTAAALSVLGLGTLGWSLMALTSHVVDRPRLLLVVSVTSASAFITLFFVERRKGKKAMLPPALFAGRAVVGLSLFTVALYGAFTATLILFPFVMIQGAHLSALLAGLAFVPLQILITVVSPFAGVLCRRFGHSLPLVFGALVTSLGCATALRIDVAAHYWTDIFPAVALEAIGMSLVVAPMTTLALTSVDTRHAATASGFNGALSRAGSLSAIAMLGGVLQRSGGELIQGFHAAMLVSAVACLVAALSAMAIPPAAEPDPEFGL